MTRRGTNAYITMVSCADCGKVLLKEPKETTRTDTTMTTMAPGECPHPESRISWRGTCNGHAANAVRVRVTARPQELRNLFQDDNVVYLPWRIPEVDRQEDHKRPAVKQLDTLQEDLESSNFVRR